MKCRWPCPYRRSSRFFKATIQNPHPLPTPQRVRHPQRKVQSHNRPQITSALTTSVVSSTFVMGQDEENAQRCERMGHPPATEGPGVLIENSNLPQVKAKSPQ